MRKTIDKLSAAKEQLDEAIRIFFDEGNEIAIHTLAMASHEILDSICRYKSLERGAVEECIKLIKPETRKSIRIKINKAKNFFKHAKGDPEEVLEWEPQVTEYFLLDATNLYRRLVPLAATKEIAIYSLWFRLHHDDMWIEAGISPLDALLKDVKPQLLPLERREFYQLSSEAFDRGFLSTPVPSA